MEVKGNLKVDGTLTVGGAAVGVSFTDGTRTYTNASKLSLSRNEFYLSTGSTGQPVANLKMSRGKDITIEFPSATEDATWFFTPVALTIVAIKGVVTGTSSPSCTVSAVRHGTDRNATGTNALAAAFAVNSTTTAQNLTLNGSNLSIAANSWIWIETSAASAAITSMALSIQFKET